jgi:hypothetical protein
VPIPTDAPTGRDPDDAVASLEVSAGRVAERGEVPSARISAGGHPTTPSRASGTLGATLVFAVAMVAFVDVDASQLAGIGLILLSTTWMITGAVRRRALER